MTGITYTTVSDVRHHSAIARSTSECTIASIPMVERSLFFGDLAFLKEEVEAHYIDYSNISKWDANKNYVVGDTVLYKGEYKIAIKNSINEAPSKYTFWEDAPKFDKECLNDLWCNYVLPYIAHMVVHNDQPVLIEAVSIGTGSGRDYISTGSVKMLQEQSLLLAKMAYDNLMNEIKSTGCVAYPIDTCDTDCGEEKKQFESSPDNQLGSIKFY